MTSHQFTFEQATIPLYGEGALFYGEATLESSCEDDSEFYVSSIQLGNKAVLTRPSRINNADPVGAFLFTEIVKQIEDDKTEVGRQAALEWAAAVEDQSFDAWRFARIPEIAPTPSYRMEAAE
ncbi:hypothetical protein FBZ98_1011001 [Rhizobium sp. ERR 922]|uniref:hypothetical protein n=1 Tax=unclassified Rhizobium TaxID=2613769 RepID=UPI0011A13728|nr:MULTISPECIES: hypothetical protein [unclassified Rhizobium]TWB61656.1 hypothetical protein FBZ98_1011001 [Rhizobium sp. ERR 922]TWC04582.1 hypothetical protein FBZ97_1011001 [Rhizobium sp. ERR 942]